MPPTASVGQHLQGCVRALVNAGNCRQSMYEQVPRERRVLLVVNGTRGARAGPGGLPLMGRPLRPRFTRRAEHQSLTSPVGAEVAPPPSMAPEDAQACL